MTATSALQRLEDAFCLPSNPFNPMRTGMRSVLAVFALLAFAPCLLPGVHAQSPAPAVAEAAKLPVRYGSVLRIRGAVTASDGDLRNSRVLAVGDPVFVGDRISADATAEALFKTDDAGYLALRSGGDFVAERFSAKGNPSDQFVLRIFAGALRVVTGWIGHTNRSGARIFTPSATIGIRGTDHEPYVMSPELASQLLQTPGTYDKVNRGGTTLESRGNTLDLEPGKVGFVRNSRTRGLLTLLLPVLLDRVPEFYVPGQFDAELDTLSEQAPEKSLQELELQRAKPTRTGAADPAQTGLQAVPGTVQPAPTPLASPAAPDNARVAAGPDMCNAAAIAREWLARFDAAIVRRDSAAVLVMFAPEALVKAKIIGKDGTATELDFTRDELVQSAIAALDGLTEYSQRRPLIEGRVVSAGTCDRLEITSISIEQGRQQGRPYRFEALESYSLQLQAGEWRAVKASTSQR
ncbi:MAG TPA: hypothetical protein PLJ46_08090 [Burkholderiaceae bacterium]|nr:hypothetical protein [Rhodoferax sp.]HQZ05816.1 hypothetical protein [Burkholderiaceae bacterium]